MRVLAAPDKFRGTLTAAEAASAMAAPFVDAGHAAALIPLADGGEGLLDVLGGANRSTRVTGPLGQPVDAGWRFDGRRAVIEMARASGLVLAGGPDANDAVAATSRGTGELIAAAIDAGARDIVVGLGGSATTDGGFGALEAIPRARLGGVRIRVACDVALGFVDAAEVFAPQKGATAIQVKLLRRRLEALAVELADRTGVDVTTLPHAGAAGGLAGGLASIGAELVSGFELVAEELGLPDALDGADLVVTGEGHLDAESFDGKVVGGVCELAGEAGVPVLVVVGSAERGLVLPHVVLDVIDLAEQVGADEAFGAAASAISRSISAWSASPAGRAWMERHA